MNIKKKFQYSLLFILFLISFIFYHKYFASNTKETEKNKLENRYVNENTNVNNDNTDKNIIENLKYVSEDLLGNIYKITAQSASLRENNLDEVQLYEVNAEIVNKSQEIIYIYSKTANYNKLNNNTIFKKEVNVKYGEQTIESEILNLNFKDNLIEILGNVYFVNKNTKINADKAEIDLIYKDLKITMINKKDKVHITSKY